MKGKIFVRLAVIAGLSLSALLLLTGEIFAHGTGWRNSAFSAVALEFIYSTGETMSYREARVFSPNDEKFAYQSGRTDEKGRFAFVPDTPGKWRVIVRDEEGHQCTADIVVSDTVSSGQGEGVSESEIQSAVINSTEIFIRSLLGVSLIFNIALVIRRKYAH